MTEWCCTQKYHKNIWILSLYHKICGFIYCFFGFRAYVDCISFYTWCTFQLFTLTSIKNSILFQEMLKVINFEQLNTINSQPFKRYQRNHFQSLFLRPRSLFGSIYFSFWCNCQNIAWGMTTAVFKIQEPCNIYIRISWALINQTFIPLNYLQLTLLLFL